MTPGLPLFHRIAGQPVIVAGSGDAFTARRRLVETAGGRIVAADNVEARLAFLAGEDGAALAAGLRARGVLVNVADRPELCDFLVPALIDRAPVQIAIGTGGASAGLAKALRLRLEALLPASLGPLATALAAARPAMRQRWPDPADRRRMIDAALGDGGCLDPLRESAPDAVPLWLEAGAQGEPGVPVEIVLSSDDPEDLTLRAARWLGRADVVLYEAGVPPAILARARADAVRHPLGADPGQQHNRGLVVTVRRLAMF